MHAQVSKYFKTGLLPRSSCKYHRSLLPNNWMLPNNWLLPNNWPSSLENLNVLPSLLLAAFSSNWMLCVVHTTETVGPWRERTWSCEIFLVRLFLFLHFCPTDKPPQTIHLFLLAMPWQKFLDVAVVNNNKDKHSWPARVRRTTEGRVSSRFQGFELSTPPLGGVSIPWGTCNNLVIYSWLMINFDNVAILILFFNISQTLIQSNLIFCAIAVAETCFRVAPTGLICRHFRSSSEKHSLTPSSRFVPPSLCDRLCII